MLAHAALHGHSLATIRALTAPGRPWHTGLAAAYTRYRHNADTRARTRLHQSLSLGRRQQPQIPTSPCTRPMNYTHGGDLRGPRLLRSWLANATAWLDTEYAGHRYRWIGAAIFQALAIHAARSGEIINGVPVVGVGGRSLSLATGLLSETTVWDFLRTIRDRPGAPLVRTRAAQGRDADFYALTRQNPAPVDDAAIASARVEDVHPAWKVIGHQHRRIYELIVHRGLTNPHDICAAAHVSTSTGYTSLAALATAGLIRRGRGAVASGQSASTSSPPPTTSTTTAPNGSARHQRQRATWHAWLAIRDAVRDLPAPGYASANQVAAYNTPTDQEEYLASVMATGPPPADVEHEVLDMVIDMLGARVIARVT